MQVILWNIENLFSSFSLSQYSEVIYTLKNFYSFHNYNKLMSKAFLKVMSDIKKQKAK